MGRSQDGARWTPAGVLLAVAAAAVAGSLLGETFGGVAPKMPLEFEFKTRHVPPKLKIPRPLAPTRFVTCEGMGGFGNQLLSVGRAGFLAREMEASLVWQPNSEQFETIFANFDLVPVSERFGITLGRGYLTDFDVGVQPASLDSGGSAEADCAVRGQWAGGGATKCISWFQNHSGRVIRHLGGGEAFGWGNGQSKRYFESVGQAERMPTKDEWNRQLVVYLGEFIRLALAHPRPPLHARLAAFTTARFKGHPYIGLHSRDLNPVQQKWTGPLRNRWDYGSDLVFQAHLNDSAARHELLPALIIQELVNAGMRQPYVFVGSDGRPHSKIVTGRLKNATFIDSRGTTKPQFNTVLWEAADTARNTDTHGSIGEMASLEQRMAFLADLCLLINATVFIGNDASTFSTVIWLARGRHRPYRLLYAVTLGLTRTIEPDAL